MHLKSLQENCLQGLPSHLAITNKAHKQESKQQWDNNCFMLSLQRLLTITHFYNMFGLKQADPIPLIRERLLGRRYSPLLLLRSVAVTSESQDAARSLLQEGECYIWETLMLWLSVCARWVSMEL